MSAGWYSADTLAELVSFIVKGISAGLLLGIGWAVLFRTKTARGK